MQLIQRRLDLCTLLKAPSIGTEIILSKFKEDLRKEAGSLHDTVGQAVKQLKKVGRSDLARELEAGVRQIYAAPRQRHAIEKLKPPGSARNLTVRA